jgi:predicted small secreted protein
MKSLISCLTIILAIFALNSCNTFSGMGKDLQAGGRAITNAANDASSSNKTTTNTQTVGKPVTTTQTQQ